MNDENDVSMINPIVMLEFNNFGFLRFGVVDMNGVFRIVFILENEETEDEIRVLHVNTQLTADSYEEAAWKIMSIKDTGIFSGMEVDLRGLVFDTTMEIINEFNWLTYMYPISMSLTLQ